MERHLLWPSRTTVACVALALAVTARTSAAELHLGGSIDTLGVLRLDSPSPRQRPLARVELFAEQAITPELRWRLSTVGRFRGTIENASGAGLIDFGHSFQNVDPSLQLDEAWGEWLGESFDVRLGNQRFTWGRLDGVKPNDQLNPLRYYDPLIGKDHEHKIAVPAAALSYYFPAAWRAQLPDEARVTLVWEPIGVPWLFPEQDERWFPPAAATRADLPVMSLGGALLNGKDPCPCLIHITQQLRNSPPPARRFDNGNVALRLSGRSSGVDWSAVYFDGFDPAASFTVPVHLALDGGAGTPGMFGATAQTQLKPAYLRYRSLGADASAVFGGLTTRFEAAWRFRRPYPRDVRSLSGEILDNPAQIETLLKGGTVTLNAFEQRDAVEWGLGADYLIDGYLPLIELYQVILMNNDVPLLIRNVDTRLTASVRKSFLADRLTTELVGLWGIESTYELVRLEATYAVTDQIGVGAGVLGIWGNQVSLIGEFNRNSQAYGRISYSF